jgi:hypothetical protein
MMWGQGIGVGVRVRCLMEEPLQHLKICAQKRSPNNVYTQEISSLLAKWLPSFDVELRNGQRGKARVGE